MKGRSLVLTIDGSNLSLATVQEFSFRRKSYGEFRFSAECVKRVESSQRVMLNLIEKNIPIYGVTTGYGDSCHRVISKNRSSELQHNLVSYLRCGTGKQLSTFATRAMCLIRLQSLARGYSGVSIQLLESIANLLAHDVLPIVPMEGSLGASGDLIPLAYLGALLEGEGKAQTTAGEVDAAFALQSIGAKPYQFGPKEGLAIVNGTSTMAGLALENLTYAQHILELSQIATSWLCLCLHGKVEAFGKVVNDRAKSFVGQSKVAAAIRGLLDAESYSTVAATGVPIKDQQTDGFVQDRYSLRCTPQILGPVLETIELAWTWLDQEINSTSDNPLVDPDTEELAVGGNFYGGYLGHGMDYLKISLAHIADLLDRQLMTLIDDKTNRGLPPNLANWPGLAADEKHLHHGLKGLHQATNALTSEVLAMSMPNGVFSRSSELHNQDKVSLGMSAASSCADMLEKMYSITTLYLICLAQAIDLRKIKLKGEASKNLYATIRGHVDFCEKDASLGHKISSLRSRLIDEARTSSKVDA